MTGSARLDAILAGLSIEERLAQKPVKAWLPVLGLSLPATYRALADGRLGHVKHDGTTRKGGRGRSGKVTLSWEHVAPFLAARWVDAKEPKR
ncbi:MAG: hypothetical protein ACYC4P_11660 [Thermoanaerobaculia bacterium]